MVYKNFQINGVDATKADFVRLAKDIQKQKTHIFAVRITIYANDEGINFNYLTND